MFRSNSLFVAVTVAQRDLKCHHSVARAPWLQASSSFNAPPSILSIMSIKGYARSSTCQVPLLKCLQLLKFPISELED